MPPEIDNQLPPAPRNPIQKIVVYVVVLFKKGIDDYLSHILIAGVCFGIWWAYSYVHGEAQKITTLPDKYIVQHKNDSLRDIRDRQHAKEDSIREYQSAMIIIRQNKKIDSLTGEVAKHREWINELWIAADPEHKNQKPK